MDVWGFNPRELGEEQQRQYLSNIVQRANKRMYRLEKSGKFSYALQRAQKELSSKGRKHFTTRGLSSKEVMDEIMLVEAFLAHKSSLVSELKKIQKRAFITLKEKMKREYGSDFEGVDIEKESFYKFLNTRAFEDLAKLYGSGNIIDDIVSAMKEHKLSFKEIIKEYKAFIKEELPLDALELKRRGLIKGYGEYKEFIKQHEAD